MVASRPRQARLPHLRFNLTGEPEFDHIVPLCSTELHNEETYILILSFSLQLGVILRRSGR